MRRSLAMSSRAPDRRSASKCRGKCPDQRHQPLFGPPEASVAVCAPRLPCRKAEKVRVSTPGRESSGESRFNDLSRIVSHALRHAPWLFELEIDDEGWVPTEALINALRKEGPAWSNLTERDLSEMLRVSSKRRHEMANGRIRALYGHSLSGRLRKTPAIPPSELFHGTSPSSIIEIRSKGLLPMARQFVHLSVDETSALEVGKRKSRNPIILSIKALNAFKSGVPFYIGNERVWLAPSVPVSYIEFKD
jgi:putative RNA 2'-phosphotransferase